MKKLPQEIEQRTGGRDTGTTYHADGSYSTYANDGQGQIITKNYSSGGVLTGSSISETNGLNNTITSYLDAAGAKLSETWVHRDGSCGTDTFGGSSSGTSYLAGGGMRWRCREAIAFSGKSANDVEGRIAA